MTTVTVVLFAAGSIALAIFSRRSLVHPGSHGFPRFIAMELLLALILVQVLLWFDDPFSMHQIVSWLVLFLSIPLPIIGIQALKHSGKPLTHAGEGTNLKFENTTRLVTTGVYRYIRHPMYASLLALALGAYLKDVTTVATALFAGTTLALVATALAEERENIARFGDEYREYRKTTKRFIPFLF